MKRVHDLMSEYKSFVLENAEASMLAELTERTRAAYESFLKGVCEWKQEPFAPWDLQYILKRIELALEREFSHSFPLTSLPVALKRSLTDCGLDAGEYALYFFDERGVVKPPEI